MTMQPDRIDAVIQYALAVARCAHDEDWMLRDLGPIHLIKYVYLADLAHAARHGSSFTGAPWTFHHFGPWAAPVLDRIHPAAAAIGAEEKRIAGKYRDDFSRWYIPRLDDAEGVCKRIGRGLPVEVDLGLRRAVKDFGNATAALLHFVYGTAPMVRAAPGDELDFSIAKVERTPGTAEPSDAGALRAKAIKKRKELLADARQRFQERAQARLQARGTSVALQPEPRYDQVFEEGTRLLDELAGASLDGVAGTLEFGEGVWASAVRRGGEADDDE